MTWEEAIKYCEEHECEECPVYENDKRNEFERMQFVRYIPLPSLAISATVVE